MGPIVLTTTYTIYIIHAPIVQWSSMYYYCLRLRVSNPHYTYTLVKHCLCNKVLYLTKHFDIWLPLIGSNCVANMNVTTTATMFQQIKTTATTQYTTVVFYSLHIYIYIFFCKNDQIYILHCFSILHFTNVVYLFIFCIQICREVIRSLIRNLRKLHKKSSKCQSGPYQRNFGPWDRKNYILNFKKIFS